MSLYDWFFPEQSQATQLRRLADQNRRSRMSRSRESFDLGQRISRLEEDAGFISLVLGAVLKILKTKGNVTEHDLRITMSGLDRLDGVTDGRFDVAMLKETNFQVDVLHILDADDETSPPRARHGDHDGLESPIPGYQPQLVQDNSEDSAAQSVEEIDAAIERLQNEIAELRQLRQQQPGRPTDETN